MLDTSFTLSGSESRPAPGLVRGFGLASVLLGLSAVVIGTCPSSAAA